MSSRTLDVFMSILAVASIVLILYDFLVPLASHEVTVVLAADLVISIIFGLDFLNRLSKASDRRRYLKRHCYEILAAVPAISFVLLDSNMMLGAALRSIRMIRLLVVSSRLLRLIYVLSEVLSRSRILYLTVFAAIIVILGATGVLILEENVPGAKITNLSDAIWWSLATVTTVGYGDVVPVTPEGRVLGVLVMIVGIAFLSIFISTLGATLVERRFRPDKKNLTDSTVDIIKEKLDRIDTLSKEEAKLLKSLVSTLINEKQPTLQDENSTH